MAGHSPNRVLRELMRSRRLTREALADAICDASVKLCGKPVACSARQVGRWLSGESTWPWSRYRAPLEVVFGLPAEDLGFTPPASYSGAIVPEKPTAEEPPVLRRQFLIGLGTVLALPSLPTSGRLGPTDVNATQAAAAQLHALDDRHGGAKLAGVAARYVQHVEKSANTCSYGTAVQKHLHSSIGELCASAGWFAYDGGLQIDARRWWDMAIRYAALAGDTLLMARIWSYMSRQAVDLGHGGEAVAIARVALDTTRGRRDPRLSALLHARVALGLSVVGDRARAGQSLHRAEQQLDRAGSATAPWLNFCGPAEIAGQAALVDYNLGKYAAAVDRDRHSLSLMPRTSFGRNSFATEVSLARNHLAAGHADEAIAAGHCALDLMPGVKSPRWGRRLAALVTHVQAGRPPGAGEFAERYREVIAS